MENEFWQFSDKLRLETTSSFANLSIGDSIWADSFLTKSRAEERRNFDASRRAAHAPGSIMGAGPLGGKQQPELKDPVFDLNFNDNGWKEQQRAPAFNLNHNGGGWREEPKGPLLDLNADGGGWKQQQQNRPVFDLNLNGGGWKSAMGGSKSAFANGGGSLFNKEVGSSPGSLIDKDMNKAMNGFGHHQNRRNTDNNDVGKGKGAAGMRKGGKNNSSNDKNGNDRAAADKRFKTLPASEALPRSEAIGGYIFVCNNDTMQENLRRQLFGLPPRYRDSVRTITPGLPLFLYNYSTHQLHGIFEAASFGGTNIDPTAWEDKKCQGESRFPAQVRVMTRKICEPLEEDSFRPVLHHYDGPKFRLELSVPEALALLDIFVENDA